MIKNSMLTIKKLRDITGLSQSQFSNKTKIPIKTLQKWEIGQSSPSPYVLMMLAFIIKEHLLDAYMESTKEDD